jgi:hypothetical protein
MKFHKEKTEGVIRRDRGSHKKETEGVTRETEEVTKKRQKESLGDTK